MERVDAPEILDSQACLPQESQAVLRVLGRINRWFGGVSTTRKMVERVAGATCTKHFSLLEVAAGLGEVPGQVRRELARRGITLEVTLLDVARSHLPVGKTTSTHLNGGSRGVVADALTLPFGDETFDLVSCNLFAHHLNPEQLLQFVKESRRVGRRAVLINDLVRHPIHLALAYAGYPLMRNRVAWLDGLTSVRRAYVPDEMRSMLADGLSKQMSPQVEISRYYLFRMGVIVWKTPTGSERSPSAQPALP